MEKILWAKTKTGLSKFATFLLGFSGFTILVAGAILGIDIFLGYCALSAAIKTKLKCALGIGVVGGVLVLLETGTSIYKAFKNKKMFEKAVSEIEEGLEEVNKEKPKLRF
jgi:hypothetical protein